MPMGARRLLVPALLLLVVAGVTLGLVTGLVGSATSAGLEALGLRRSTAASTLSPGALDPSAVATASSTPASSPTASSAQPPPSALPAPVLAELADPPAPRAAAVAAKVRAVKVAGSGGYSGAVLDVGSGRTVFANNAGRAFIPASTMKLLTGATALSVLGPERRFTTKVVSPKPGQVVLVGGGDPYLEVRPNAKDKPARASLTTLARRTATPLKQAGVRRVSLGYDTSLFRGPAWNPTWPDRYANQVSRVSALWVNEGRVTPRGGVVGPRHRDPAKIAATAFAAALEKQGIAVGPVRPARAPASAEPVASVASMPVERMVEDMLMTSDNDSAEVLLRQAAIGAGRRGTFEDGVATVKAELVRLDAWHAGTRLHDGSGLSRDIRVPATTLVEVLRAAGDPDHPELRAVLTGLPVAGVEGSLAGRFGDDASLAGRGVVRGKTGTLRKVHALAGTVRTRDGSLLAYAFLVNNPKNEYNATIWLQRVTSALSTCGCR